MNSAIASLAVALNILSFSQLGLVSGTIPQIEPETYVETDQHALVNPSIVRVVHHVKGNIVVKPFSLDDETLEAVPVQYYDEPLEVPVDENMSGTAFSVSEDGIYVTNAHVVSRNTYLYAFALEVFKTVLYNKYTDLMNEWGENSSQVADFEDTVNSVLENAGGEKSEKIRNSLMSFVTLEDDESEIVILDQDVDVSDVDDIFDYGEPAKIIAVDDDWVGDGRDVAVLKVDDSDFTTPAVSLAGTNMVAINTPVAVYGFPGSTNIDTILSNSITVTQGKVTSIKKLGNSDIDAYQIDAKVSKGSSGGPVVDDSGRVIGVVTLETGTEEGDNFGFSLPVSIVHELLDDADVENLKTEYQAYMREGLALQNQRHCKKAIESFEKALHAVVDSKSATKEVKRNITKCEEMISSGRSIDNTYDKIREWVISIGTITWMLIAGGIVLFIIIIVMIIILLNKLREDQEQIDKLEDEIEDIESAHDSSGKNVSADSQVYKEDVKREQAEAKTIEELKENVLRRKNAGVTNDENDIFDANEV